MPRLTLHCTARERQQDGIESAPEEQGRHQRTYTRPPATPENSTCTADWGFQSLSEEEQKLFRLYGKLPNKKDLFSKKLQERKYFDSGDYALSKAGKSDTSTLGGGLGREHPT